MALEGYEIHQIPNRQAQEMVIENHYLHRKSPAMFSYGLFSPTGQMVGCIVYGKPASPSLCKGIAGEDESQNVIELTRLWIADITPKNAESYLIGNTLKMLPKQYDIIVSYAEIGAGHSGTVYQATNWLYTGLSSAHVEWRLEGQSNKHSRHLFDQYGGIEGAKRHFGDKLIKTERGRKHRYVMLRGSKVRKKQLREKLRYKIEEYP